MPPYICRKSSREFVWSGLGTNSRSFKVDMVRKQMFLGVLECTLRQLGIIKALENLSEPLSTPIMTNTINTDLFDVSHTFHFPSNITTQYFANGSAFSPCESNWHSITLSQCIRVVKSLLESSTAHSEHFAEFQLFVSAARMTIHLVLLSTCPVLSYPFQPVLLKMQNAWMSLSYHVSFRCSSIVAGNSWERSKERERH